MAKRIFRTVLIVVTLVLLLSFTVTVAVLYSHFIHIEQNHLKDELNLAVDGVEMSGKAYLENLSGSDRLTWVSPNGTVLYDTAVDYQDMDNHTEREEISRAFIDGEGESVRYSETLMQKTVYHARLLPDRTVLRISKEFGTVIAMLADAVIPMLFIYISAVIVSAFAARHIARRIVEPLNELNLDDPQENDAYDEIVPLLKRIQDQHTQISRQMNELRRRADEFSQITNSIAEGLILLDKDGFVLSMNRAAKRLFHVVGDPTGCDFLTISRNPEMSRALIKADEGCDSEFTTDIEGAVYRVGISRILTCDKTIGTAIICFDVTQAAFAERNRKEFTANVSHELKTPLQSIMGSAELLENGLVKPEDTGRFLGHIKTETQRMIALINDIIHLTQLDESKPSVKERVDIAEVAHVVLENLQGFAENKGVTLEFDCEDCIIEGSPEYVYQIIFNLCDNAIRYNRRGGKVKLRVRKNAEDHTEISVSDTGIGIPAEHLSRIFERFYRVDKSHSKETGGTGLGLSIVKHAVSYHNGKIEVSSVINIGTEIRVIL